MRDMKRILAALGLAAFLGLYAPAQAAERTVILELGNLFCPSCPYIVHQTLADVPGVRFVEVSYETKTAVVTFEDTETDVAALTDATARIGFPSRLLPQ